MIRQNAARFWSIVWKKRGRHGVLVLLREQQVKTWDFSDNPWAGPALDSQRDAVGTGFFSVSP